MNDTGPLPLEGEGASQKGPRIKTSARELDVATIRVPTSRWRIAGLVTVFLWFFIGGIAHFVATDAEVRIVPSYIPWPRAAVLVSGVFELIGAAGLWWTATRRSAGWVLFAVTIAVTPVHITMLQNADQWPVPYWALVVRLPLQVALLALIVWSTARPSLPTSRASSRPA